MRSEIVKIVAVELAVIAGLGLVLATPGIGVSLGLGSSFLEALKASKIVGFIIASMMGYHLLCAIAMAVYFEAKNELHDLSADEFFGRHVMVSLTGAMAAIPLSGLALIFTGLGLTSTNPEYIPAGTVPGPAVVPNASLSNHTPPISQKMQPNPDYTMGESLKFTGEIVFGLSATLYSGSAAVYGARKLLLLLRDSARRQREDEASRVLAASSVNDVVSRDGLQGPDSC